jgi:hypothetical protein
MSEQRPTYITFKFDQSDDPALQVCICLSEVMMRFDPPPDQLCVKRLTEREKKAAIDWFIARYRTP